MKRRQFLKYVGITGLLALYPKLSLSEKKKILKNYDKEGFYVRFYKPFEALDIKNWKLTVSGLCKNPRSFDLNFLKSLKKTIQVSRMKCVECWSAKAKWGGFRAKELFDIVKPKNEAKYLYVYSADDYYEYIPIEVISHPRTLFVYEMNDAPLPDEHGAPLRLIIPSKYGYKNVKTIIKLEFIEKDGVGYWSQFGYSRDATIQKGRDFPLDIGKTVEIKEEGELKY
ncbi:MAG: molybdopterin-dependent oxidoreductase [Proteobacteria bacterium]|nr:molybdopterin-dependent oxidoreductase [Pseudomonadota bacterium]